MLLTGSQWMNLCHMVQKTHASYRMGPPVDSVNRWFISGLTMVYGRYDYIVNGDYNGL